MSKLIENFDMSAYDEWPEWREDRALHDLVVRCIEAQRDACRERLAHYRPDAERARAAVSPEALETILESKRDIHGISSEREITDALALNAAHIKDAVLDRHVARLRRTLDRAVRARLERRFGRRLAVVNSGHFWYPPGSFMGWHTNGRAPGLRLYLTATETPGKSFFRYRDPATGAIETSWDRSFDARIFPITGDHAFWHAVYSETDRFSFGFLVKPYSLASSLRRRGAQLRRGIRRLRKRHVR